MIKLISINKNKGFTLIELIITIVVTGLIALPLALSLNAQINGAVSSGAYTTALNLARYEMEQVNNTPYANISSATYSNFKGYPYNVTVTVTNVPGNVNPAASLKQITVSVTKTGSATVLASLTTYIGSTPKLPTSS